MTTLLPGGMMRLRFVLETVLLVTMSALGLGCSSSTASGTSNGSGNQSATRVVVTPGTFSRVVGDTQRFAAAALTASGTAVSAGFTWGATGGSVTSTGLFTAGPAVGPALVWAATGALADTAEGVVAAGGGGTHVDTVFAEGFESGSFAVWDDRGLTANQAIVTTQSHSGSRSLEVTFPTGSDGGWLTKFFLPGYDSLYASYWVLFQAGWQSGTKLLAFYGSRTDNQWSATGKAGVCPNGTDFFSLDVVQERSGNPGPTHFYAYYPAMPQTPAGSGTCYGHNGISAGAVYTLPLEILPGSWHHVEYWVALNTPGQSNAVQRFCVDGVVRGDWSGISVRTGNILLLNAVTISNSIANGSPVTQKMWADELLVTRQRPPGAC